MHQSKSTIVEVYVKPEYYHPRLRATVPGAWTAVFSNGHEVAICPDWAVATADEARAMLVARNGW